MLDVLALRWITNCFGEILPGEGSRAEQRESALGHDGEDGAALPGRTERVGDGIPPSSEGKAC